MNRHTFYILIAAMTLMSACGKQSGNTLAHESSASVPPVQTATVGSIDRHYLYSPQMGDTITIDVWTPESYALSPAQRYPVIYMHDGQNLFDATTTWNGQSWEMDSVVSSLASDGAIPYAVIVGVHSVNATRIGDLMPENALNYITSEPDSALREFMSYSPIRGNAYVSFLVNTLKPCIDSLYNVTTNRDSTFVMGSSMGGLMSIYAMSEYPDIFGGAGCLSTHWVGTLDGDTTFADAMYKYLSEKLPRDGKHKLYLDHGTISIDSLYRSDDDRVVALAKTMGYVSDRQDSEINFETHIEEGAGHEEKYWAARVERPLRFLLNKKN